MKNQLRHIVWDWNGTLLDDLEVCIESINILLTQRMLPIMEKNRYKEIFTFPIRLYYEAAGFDFSKEAFEVPAEEFILEYKRLMHKARLFPDVVKTLSRFASMGYKQYVLSAMEEKALKAALSEHLIDQYFDGIYGVHDNFAVSKIERGRSMISDNLLNGLDTVVVGDTLHDAEVAKALKLPAVLIGQGHQDRNRLTETGFPVLNDIGELSDLIVNGHLAGR
jgi:phosphoglycolate phosphatase